MTYILLILIFHKILVSTFVLIFLKSSVLISSDQCSVLRQWGERVGSICSNSSNRFCPAEEDAIKIGESIRRWSGIRPTIVYQLPSVGIFVTKETKGC